MYKTIITLKNTIPANAFSSVCGVLSAAFDNRAGKRQNVSKDPNVLLFEGGEDAYGCLDLGMLALKENTVLSYVKSMRWVDEDPGESCDMLEVLARQVAHS